MEHGGTAKEIPRRINHEHTQNTNTQKNHETIKKDDEKEKHANTHTQRHAHARARAHTHTNTHTHREHAKTLALRHAPLAREQAGGEGGGPAGESLESLGQQGWKLPRADTQTREMGGLHKETRRGKLAPPRLHGQVGGRQERARGGGARRRNNLRALRRLRSR